MKKNVMVSLFAGILLVITACGSQLTNSYDSSENKADTIVIGQDRIPLAPDAEKGEDDSETNPEVNDLFSRLDEIKPGEDGTISNGLFSFQMPEGTESTYIAYSSKDSIYLYDKDAKESGFGGFVYSISVYKNPKDYAGGLDVKIGEMTLSDGTVYDVVKEDPSDVQWDYEKNEEAPGSYMNLKNSYEEAIKTLKPFDTGSFELGGGTKGADLYGEELAQIRTAIDEGYDANKLEEMNLSSMYYPISQTGDALKKVGYAFYDVNVDGIEELVVGEITNGDMKGVVYDLYTMVDRQPQHVLSGYARDRYFVLEGGLMVNEASGGADITEWKTFAVEANSVNILNQYALKYDGQNTEENPYYINFDDEKDKWESITEEDFNMFKDRMEYKRFDYTAFG